MENSIETNPANQSNSILHQESIADSLGKQIAAFQKTFIWTILFAAVIGLGSLQTNVAEVKVLGVAVPKSTAYAICLGIYTIVNGVFAMYALNILLGFRRLDTSFVSTGATKLLVAPGILNPLACLGPSWIARIASSLSYGMPLFVWWLMYLSTLGLETAAGERSEFRNVFIGSGVIVGVTFAYAYLDILRRLMAAKNFLFEEAQKLIWPKFFVSVLCYWIGAAVYHIARVTPIRSVWEILDILVFYPFVFTVPWWGDFKRKWLLNLLLVSFFLGMSALFFGANKNGFMLMSFAVTCLAAFVVKLLQGKDESKILIVK